MQIETMLAIESLRSEMCPACGNTKRPRHSLCRGCYRRLPVDDRDALYRRLGKGYEEALSEALKLLAVAKPHWPAEAGKGQDR